MLQQISNGRILTAEGWLNDGSIVVEDGKILAVSNNALPVEGAKQIDAKGCDIVPGGIELHIHGGGGRDFMEGTEEAFRTAVNAHMQHGTTGHFPHPLLQLPRMDRQSHRDLRKVDGRTGKSGDGLAPRRTVFQPEKGRCTDA